MVLASGLMSIDEARKQLFSKTSQTMDAISPTKAALKQHIKRARVELGGHCWGRMLQSQQNNATTRTMKTD